MQRSRLLAFILLIAVFVAPVGAQQHATLKRNVNLRPTASNSQTEIRILEPLGSGDLQLRCAAVVYSLLPKP
jgi:hypothetical protein